MQSEKTGSALIAYKVLLERARDDAEREIKTICFFQRAEGAVGWQ